METQNNMGQEVGNGSSVLLEPMFSNNFSFFDCVADLWNGLPAAIRTIEQQLLSSFSKKLNQF